jgi:hypothetical protein
MTRWGILAVLLAALLPLTAQADPAAVERSFAAYKQALVDGDGAAASALTAADTHAYLDETLNRALTMKAEDLRLLPLLDQISVLMMRHNMTAAELRAMKDGDPVAYAVDNGAFDMNEVEKLSAGDFTVTGGQAQAPISSSSAAGRAAMSPRSARRSSDSRPRSWSASISAASASTGAASRPRRCCARPRSTTTCSTPRISASSREDQATTGGGRRALARGRRAHEQRRRLPDEEEQDHVIWKARQNLQGPGKDGQAVEGPRMPEPIRRSTSSSRPARARACCRASSRTRS